MTAADIRSSRFWAGFFNLYIDIKLHCIDISIQLLEKETGLLVLKQWSVARMIIEVRPCTNT